MPELTPKLGIKKPLGNETVSRAAFNENYDIIDAQAQKNIAQGAAAPASPTEGDLWIDTSTSPNALKRYSAGNWVKIGAVSPADIGAVANAGNAPSIQAGLDAQKPAPGTAGRLYVATDTQIIYRDTGSAWAKVGVVRWGDIDGKPATFPPSAHTHAGSDITSKVSSASAADTVPWSGVSGKPSSFPPSAHKDTHKTGGPDALTPGDIGAAAASDLAAHLADKAPHPNIPAARVYHSLAQSIPNNTDTVLSFDREKFDTDSIHDPAVNNSRLTCQTSGKYLIGCNIWFATNGTGVRTVKIRLNGSVVIAWSLVVPASSFGTVIELSTVYNLAKNDYVEVVVVQTSGAALDVQCAYDYSPHFYMIRVG